MRDQIRAEICRILGSAPEGCGWYALEMRVGISREKFPPDTNIMTFLDELESEGVVRRKEVNGKELFVLARPAV